MITCSDFKPYSEKQGLKVERSCPDVRKQVLLPYMVLNFIRKRICWGVLELLHFSS